MQAQHGVYCQHDVSQNWLPHETLVSTPEFPFPLLVSLVLMGHGNRACVWQGKGSFIQMLAIVPTHPLYLECLSALFSLAAEASTTCSNSACFNATSHSNFGAT